RPSPGEPIDLDGPEGREHRSRVIVGAVCKPAGEGADLPTESEVLLLPPTVVGLVGEPVPGDVSPRCSAAHRQLPAPPDVAPGPHKIKKAHRGGSGPLWFIRLSTLGFSVFLPLCTCCCPCCCFCSSSFPWNICSGRAWHMHARKSG